MHELFLAGAVVLDQLWLVSLWMLAKGATLIKIEIERGQVGKIRKEGLESNKTIMLSFS
jgi:hypothetical protein